MGLDDCVKLCGIGINGDEGETKCMRVCVCVCGCVCVCVCVKINVKMISRLERQRLADLTMSVVSFVTLCRLSINGRRKESVRASACLCVCVCR